MRLKVCLYALLLFAISVGVVAAEDIVMVFGEGGYAPFYLKAESGSNIVTKGMFVDFLNEFMKAYPEFKITMLAFPRARMTAMMEDGEAQAFSLNNPLFAGDKAKDYLWSDVIWRTADAIYSLKEKPLVFSKNEDLFGKTLGCILGNGYGEFDALFAAKKIKDERTSNSLQLFRMLQAYRVDGVIGNIHNTPYMLKLNGIDPSLFVVTDKRLLEFDLMIQISKDKIAFRDKMNAFIKASKTNGLLQKLEDKWLK